MKTDATILIVPGLRDAVAQHWQTLLQARLERVVGVPPMGRAEIDCDARVAAIEHAARAIQGPIVIVAHSAGCVTTAHWAQRTRRLVRGALLATPPDFERPMPAGYPSTEDLRAAGWLPVPRTPLPFTSIVAASGNDPLASFARVEQMARDWHAELVDLGEVGHLNPAAGYGEWPVADVLISRLDAMGAQRHATA